MTNPVLSAKSFRINTLCIERSRKRGTLIKGCVAFVRVPAIPRVRLLRRILRQPCAAFCAAFRCSFKIGVRYLKISKRPANPYLSGRVGLSAGARHSWETRDGSAR